MNNLRYTSQILQITSYGALAGTVLLIASKTYAADIEGQGQIHASMRTSLIENSYYIRNAVLDRLDDVLDPGKIHEPTVSKNHPMFDRITTWGTIYGGLDHVSGSSSSNHMTNNTGGFVQGVDVHVGLDGRVGGYVGYGRSMFAQNSLSSNGYSNDVSAGLYGGDVFKGHIIFKAGAGYTFNIAYMNRALANQNLSSNQLGGTFQAFTELGYKFHNKSKSFMFEPLARGAYVYEQTRAYKEHGGNDALHGCDTHSGIPYGAWGARVSYDFTIKGISFDWSSLVAYRHAFEDIKPKMRQRSIVSGDDFTVTGANVSKDTALVNTGINAHLNDQLSMGINYIGQYGAHQTSSGGQIRGRFNF